MTHIDRGDPAQDRLFDFAGLHWSGSTAQPQRVRLRRAARSYAPLQGRSSSIHLRRPGSLGNFLAPHRPRGPIVGYYSPFRQRTRLGHHDPRGISKDTAERCEGKIYEFPQGALSSKTHLDLACVRRMA